MFDGLVSLDPSRSSNGKDADWIATVQGLAIQLLGCCLRHHLPVPANTGERDGVVGLCALSFIEPHLWDIIVERWGALFPPQGTTATKQVRVQPQRLISTSAPLKKDVTVKFVEMIHRFVNEGTEEDSATGCPSPIPTMASKGELTVTPSTVEISPSPTSGRATVPHIVVEGTSPPTTATVSADKGEVGSPPTEVRRAHPDGASPQHQSPTSPAASQDGFGGFSRAARALDYSDITTTPPSPSDAENVPHIIVSDKSNSQSATSLSTSPATVGIPTVHDKVVALRERVSRLSFALPPPLQPPTTEGSSMDLKKQQLKTLFRSRRETNYNTNTTSPLLAAAMSAAPISVGSSLRAALRRYKYHASSNQEEEIPSELSPHAAENLIRSWCGERSLEEEAADAAGMEDDSLSDGDHAATATARTAKSSNKKVVVLRDVVQDEAELRAWKENFARRAKGNAKAAEEAAIRQSDYFSRIAAALEATHHRREEAASPGTKRPRDDDEERGDGRDEEIELGVQNSNIAVVAASDLVPSGRGGGASFVHPLMINFDAVAWECNQLTNRGGVQAGCTGDGRNALLSAYQAPFAPRFIFSPNNKDEEEGPLTCFVCGCGSGYHVPSPHHASSRRSRRAEEGASLAAVVDHSDDPTLGRLAGMLQCASCRRTVHPRCVYPTQREVRGEFYCHSCRCTPTDICIAPPTTDDCSMAPSLAADVAGLRRFYSAAHGAHNPYPAKNPFPTLRVRHTGQVSTLQLFGRPAAAIQRDGHDEDRRTPTRAVVHGTPTSDSMINDQCPSLIPREYCAISSSSDSGSRPAHQPTPDNSN